MSDTRYDSCVTSGRCSIRTVIKKKTIKSANEIFSNIHHDTDFHSFISTIILKKNHTFLKTPSKPFIHSLLLSVLYLKTSTTFQLL